MSKRYDLAEVTNALGLPAGLFITRDRGKEAYPLLRQELISLPGGEALVLVFPPDQLIDVSFADETILRLGKEILSGIFGEKAILLEGLSANSLDNIRAAIDLGNSQTREPDRRAKNLALLAFAARGSGWQVVGNLADNLLDTLNLVARRKGLDARQLMSDRSLNLSAASTRLMRLYNLHLVRRKGETTERGLLYLYYFWDYIGDP